MGEAKQIIKVAKEINPGGLVKFQLFDAEDDKGKSHYQWVKDHELTFDQAKELFDYGASIGQEVFFSVFGVKYVGWCERIGVKRYKIASGFRDGKTLKAIRTSRKPLIISGEETIYSPQRWSWLYCPKGYPQIKYKIPNYELEDNGDPAEFDGFSDHTIGLDASKIALACGAQIIERHVVLSHSPLFPDDLWSSTFEEIAELVRWEKVCQEVL